MKNEKNYKTLEGEVNISKPKINFFHLLRFIAQNFEQGKYLCETHFISLDKQKLAEIIN